MAHHYSKSKSSPLLLQTHELVKKYDKKYLSVDTYVDDTNEPAHIIRSPLPRTSYFIKEFRLNGIGFLQNNFCHFFDRFLRRIGALTLIFVIFCASLWIILSHHHFDIDHLNDHHFHFHFYHRQHQPLDISHRIYIHLTNAIEYSTVRRNHWWFERRINCRVTAIYSRLCSVSHLLPPHSTILVLWG